MVSVVVATLNQEKTIQRALSSLADQSYRNWEVVCVDDGSNDSTLERVQEFQKQHPDRVRIEYRQKVGIAACKNVAVRLSKGEFILPLNPADWFEPTFMERTVAALTAYPEKSVAFTGFHKHGEQIESIKPGHFEVVFLQQKNQLTANSLYRRSVFDRAGGYRPNMVWGEEDWDFWFSACTRGVQGYRIEDPLVNCSSNPLPSKLRETHARMILNHAPFFHQKNVAEAQAIWQVVAEEALSIRPEAFG